MKIRGRDIARAMGALLACRWLREFVCTCVGHFRWRRDVVGLRVVILVLVVGAMINGVVNESSTVQRAQADPDPVLGHRGLLKRGEVGGVVERWGRLVRERVVLEVPAGQMDYVVRGSALPDSGNAWWFAYATKDRMRAFLVRAGMSEWDVAGLMSTAVAVERGGVELGGVGGVVLTPTLDQVGRLSAEGRAMLYLELGRHPYSRDQNCTLSFAGESVKQWLAGVDLRESTIELVEKFAYRNGVFVVVADLKAIGELLGDAAEYGRLVRGLNREHSWRVWLEVDEGEEVGGLAAYWGRGGREVEVGAMLSALANQAGGGRIDVRELLPVFPKRVLNTFVVGDYYAMRDCHWFAMNFFSATPEGRFEGAAAVNEEFGNYEPIAMGDAGLGDLMSYDNSVYGAHHTAVYVAEDLVMTKNSALAGAPYMLMTLEEMGVYYPRPGDVGVTALRRKSAEGAGLLGRSE